MHRDIQPLEHTIYADFLRHLLANPLDHLHHFVSEISPPKVKRRIELARLVDQESKQSQEIVNQEGRRPESVKSTQAQAADAIGGGARE